MRLEIAVLPGDGVGPEVAREAVRVLRAVAEFNDHVVRVALDRIRPDYDPRNWRAFEMTWLEDRPAPEVARALDMAVSAVYVAKSRVLARLREEVLTLAEDIPHLFPTDGSGDGG